MSDLTKLRSASYALARTLGDVNALLTGRLWSRVLNRVVGKHLLWRVWKKHL